MAATDNSVEIGVLEECDSYLLESRYFPNKLGGKPAWLDLKNLPTDLSCGFCSKPCIFLCQVYAPIDDNPSCHHRTIFVFICADPACCKPNKSDNFKVFRCQLPARNEFYPPDDPTEEEDWHPECRVENFSRVCTLCGNPAPFNCGKCRVAFYCSKEHQVAHWKLHGHRLSCSKTPTEKQIETPLLFPMFEITIEKLPDDPTPEKTEQERLKEYNDLVNKGTMDLTDDLLSMCTKEDKYFSKYKKSINECPEQVLRYKRGGPPLYIAKPDFDEHSLPKCEYCNGDRQFEFQILSTMLNEMGEAAHGFDGFEWGSLLIYTCKCSCDGAPAYKKEVLIKQDVS